MSTLRLNAQGEVLLCCGGKGCPVLKQTDNDRVSIKGNTWIISYKIYFH